MLLAASARSRLLHVWEDCSITCTSPGSQVDYKLHCVENKDTGSSTEKEEAPAKNDSPSLDWTDMRERYASESKDAAPPVSQTPSEWNCHVCTFLNMPTSVTCEMCGTTNPSLVTPGPDDDAEGAIVETNVHDNVAPEFAVWICPRCTLHNRLDLRK